MEFTLKDISCPLCEASSFEKLIPSRKIDDKAGYYQLQKEIWITLCKNCGAVFENPQINILESRNYNEEHYYNTWYNQVEAHDKLQNTYAPYRWQALSEKVNWKAVSTAIDIGATGAWSAILKKKNPHIKSILLEPSKAAIDYCGKIYPDVIPVHGVLEEYTAEIGTLDIITLFYSLYHITDPVKALLKCRELLSPDGYLIIDISHVYLLIDIWGSNKTVPWVDMEHFVRGVLVTYFSRNILRRMLLKAGFRIIDEFITEYASLGQWRGRQDYYIIAKKDDVWSENNNESYNDPEEVEWARKFIKNYSVNASVKSIEQLIKNNNVEKIYLIYNDDIYLEWILTLFRAYDVTIEKIYISELETKKLNKILKEKNLFVLNSSYQLLDTSSVAEKYHYKIINCIQGNHIKGDYGLWTYGNNNEVIITKAFLPVRDKKSRVFPFEQNVNVINI